MPMWTTLPKAITTTVVVKICLGALFTKVVLPTIVALRNLKAVPSTTVVVAMSVLTTTVVDIPWLAMVAMLRVEM